MNLKEVLLSYNLVIDNEWLDAYITLIQQNSETQSSISTQAHHFIPVSYYKRKFNCGKNTRSRWEAEQYAENDKNNFLINLIYTDHLKAHCYLALCAKENWFKFANANMITVAKKDLSLEEFINLANLTEYQIAYEELIIQKHLRKLSDSQKEKIGKAHLKENMSLEYSQKLSDAMKKRWQDNTYKAYIASVAEKTNSRSDVREKLITRNKVCPPAKGLIWITNGKAITRIKPEDFSEWEKHGWVKGRTPTIKIRRKNEKLEISILELDKYLAAGWKKYWN